MTLKCHHSNGENFSVTLKRDSVTVSSYDADAIRTGLEAGPIPLPFWHNQNTLFLRITGAMDMNKVLIIAGVIVLALS